jgi:hypothetical protein
MSGSHFAKELMIPYGSVELIVYKTNDAYSFIDGDVNVTEVSRPNPDEISINIYPTSANATILVKEAYFPTWRATANGEPVTVNDDKNTGYILLILPPGARAVTLYQQPDDLAWNALSLMTLLALLVASAILYHGKKTNLARGR